MFSVVYTMIPHSNRDSFSPFKRLTDYWIEDMCDTNYRKLLVWKITMMQLFIIFSSDSNKSVQIILECLCIIGNNLSLFTLPLIYSMTYHQQHAKIHETIAFNFITSLEEWNIVGLPTSVYIYCICVCLYNSSHEL